MRWAGAPERLGYLAILRVFDEAKAGYEVQLRPTEVAGRIESASGDGSDLDAVLRSLDALAGWGVLERSFDTAKVGSIAEYRRRRPVFQFSELGEQAYRGVRNLLAARPGEGRLQRYALRQIAELLPDLAEAIRVRDGQRVFGALNQIDLVLNQLADRSGQFYVLVGSITQQVDADVDRFVELKDVLFAHLQEFLEDLHRWAPVIAARIQDIEAIGVDEMLTLAVGADDAVFQSAHDRRVQWQRRWDGLVTWFRSADRASRIAELDRRTVNAIRELTALLRRLFEARGRGASRARDMAELAAWFWALDGSGPEAGHALFDAMFGLGGMRHLGVGYPDPETVAASTTWSAAEPVDIAVGLRERGQLPSPGRAAGVPDDRLARAQLRAIAAARLDEERRASGSLASRQLTGRTLSRAEFNALLQLANLALAAGVPVAGSLATASVGPVEVRLRASNDDCIITVEDGTFVLHGIAIELVGAP